MPPFPRTRAETKRGVRHVPERPEGDEQLVQRVREGDERAFEELVRRHEEAIYGLVARLSGQAEVAEEIAQDVFVQAWRHIDRFRGDAKVSTWLYRIAINLCRDRHDGREARGRRLETSLEETMQAGAAFASPDGAPDERIEEEEAAAGFRRALAALDEEHRAAFLLRHQEGLTPAEIARITGISEANAKVRVHRARQMILATLRELGHDV